MKPTLSELQVWMKWAITDPRGVEGALGELIFTDPVLQERFREPSPRCLDALESGAVPVERRLDVYAEGFFLRIRDVILSDFPELAVLLAEDFDEFVADYLKVFPSRSFNISEVSRDLSAFAAQKFGDDSPEADAARLGHAKMTLFFREEHPEAYSSVPHGEDSVPVLNPHLIRLKKDLLLVKTRSGIETVTLSPLEEFLLEVFADKVSLGELSAQLEEFFPHVEAHTLSASMGRFLSLGIVLGFH